MIEASRGSVRDGPVGEEGRGGAGVEVVGRSELLAQLGGVGALLRFVSPDRDARATSAPPSPEVLPHATGRRLILVDHNEVAQALPDIQHATILEVWEHHRVGDLNIPQPIVFHCEPLRWPREVRMPTSRRAFEWPIVTKRPADSGVTPNLVDYARARETFSWEAARADLDGLPGGRGLNIAHEAIDRHAAGPRVEHLAFRWIGRNGDRRDFTYRDLCLLTSRFANVLQRLGVGRGDVVMGLAGRIPELYIAALGTLKKGSVFSPLFSAFGPEPIQARMRIAKARVLVTTETLYRRKIEALRTTLPDLEHVLLVADGPGPPSELRTHDPRGLMATADDRSRSRRPIPRRSRCSTSRAARPANRKARSTCIRPSSRITRPGSSRSTCARTTSSGARPTRGG